MLRLLIIVLFLVTSCNFIKIVPPAGSESGNETASQKQSSAIAVYSSSESVQQEYTELGRLMSPARGTREEKIDYLRAEAEKLGANAIITSEDPRPGDKTKRAVRAVAIKFAK